MYTKRKYQRLSVVYSYLWLVVWYLFKVESITLNKAWSYFLLCFVSKEYIVPSMPFTKLHRDCLSMVVTVTDSIAHEPGGYSWWHSLPHKGRHSQQVLMKRWGKLVYTTLFPASLHKAMLSACLSVDGIPNAQGRLLYNWLLVHMYAGSEIKLYKDWLWQCQK